VVPRLFAVITPSWVIVAISGLLELKLIAPVPLPPVALANPVAAFAKVELPLIIRLVWLALLLL